MEYTTFGRTELRVSVAGLGCGGFSRLGQAKGASVAHSVGVVHAALDLGVNFIDTAQVYGTEPIVGEALRGRRDGIVISTKSLITKKFGSDELISGAALIANLDASLQALQTDYIDIFNLHGVMADQLAYAEDELVPALFAAREAGKIRFLGITEQFIADTRHDMLAPALKRDFWDAMMVGFNMLNPSARHSVFPATLKQRIGVQCMFAVRKALHDGPTLQKNLEEAAAAGQIDPAAFDAANPLGFLEEHAGSLVEAAYRFCRHEPGVDVVLFGTGEVAHLKDNIASINMGPLPAPVLEKLKALLGRVDSVSGQ